MVGEGMNREEVRELSISLKRRGMTVKEILVELSRLGCENDRGLPYSYTMVNGWCRGICSQRGFRNPSLVGLSEEERREHDAEMRARRLERMRAWRERHPQYGREYMRDYRSL